MACTVVLQQQQQGNEVSESYLKGLCIKNDLKNLGRPQRDKEYPTGTIECQAREEVY